MHRVHEGVALHSTQHAAMRLLEQCESLLSVLDPNQYTYRSEVIAGSTIGQHLRHVLDHFASLAPALRGEVIDYDRRQRDTPVEHDLGVGVSRLRSLGAELAAIEPQWMDRAVRVRVMLNEEGSEAELGSTMAREVAFATHHAIHHQAMIAAIATELGVVAPAGFGKAPSTAHHDRSLGARAEAAS